jgi:serine/threonine protein phosphatase PrpC
MNSHYSTHYTILNLPRRYVDSAQTIARRIAREKNPDIQRKMTEAYDVLSDQKKKEAYDKELAEKERDILSTRFLPYLQSIPSMTPSQHWQIVVENIDVKVSCSASAKDALSSQKTKALQRAANYLAVQLGGQHALSQTPSSPDDKCSFSLTLTDKLFEALTKLQHKETKVEEDVAILFKGVEDMTPVLERPASWPRPPEFLHSLELDPPSSRHKVTIHLGKDFSDPTALYHAIHNTISLKEIATEDNRKNPGNDVFILRREVGMYGGATGDVQLVMRTQKIEDLKHNMPDYAAFKRFYDEKIADLKKQAAEKQAADEKIERERIAAETKRAAQDLQQFKVLLGEPAPTETRCVELLQNMIIPGNYGSIPEAMQQEATQAWLDIAAHPRYRKILPILHEYRICLGNFSEEVKKSTALKELQIACEEEIKKDTPEHEYSHQRAQATYRRRLVDAIQKLTEQKSEEQDREKDVARILTYLECVDPLTQLDSNPNPWFNYMIQQRSLKGLEFLLAKNLVPHSGYSSNHPYNHLMDAEIKREITPTMADEMLKLFARHNLNFPEAYYLSPEDEKKYDVVRTYIERKMDGDLNRSFSSTRPDLSRIMSKIGVDSSLLCCHRDTSLARKTAEDKSSPHPYVELSEDGLTIYFPAYPDAPNYATSLKRVLDREPVNGMKLKHTNCLPHSTTVEINGKKTEYTNSITISDGKEIEHFIKNILHYPEDAINEIKRQTGFDVSAIRPAFDRKLCADNNARLTNTPDQKAVGIDFHKETRGDIKIGISSIQGKRPYQEDEVVFAVKQVEAFSQLNNEEIKKALDATSKEMASHCAAQENSKEEGTTACVAIARLAGNAVHSTIGNAGDSVAYLVILNESKGTPVVRVSKRLHDIHNAENAKECQRVVNSGGAIIQPYGSNSLRLNGDLAVLRTWGDTRHTSKGLSSELEVTSAETKLEPGEKAYLIVASDGLSDGMRIDDMAAVICRGQHEGPGALSSKLTQIALNNGSRDNISVCVVPIPPSGVPVSAAVFDGHGGASISRCAREEFYATLCKHLTAELQAKQQNQAAAASATPPLAAAAAVSMPSVAATPMPPLPSLEVPASIAASASPPTPPIAASAASKAASPPTPPIAASAASKAASAAKFFGAEERKAKQPSTTAKEALDVLKKIFYNIDYWNNKVTLSSMSSARNSAHKEVAVPKGIAEGIKVIEDFEKLPIEKKNYEKVVQALAKVAHDRIATGWCTWLFRLRKDETQVLYKALDAIYETKGKPVDYQKCIQDLKMFDEGISKQNCSPSP